MKKLNKTLKVFAVILLNLIAGAVLIAGVEYFGVPGFSGLTFLLVFIALNAGYIVVFKLRADFAEYYNLNKLPYLIIGIFAGVVLIAVPAICSVFLNHSSFSTFHLNRFSISAFFFGFVIVAWEELWFRGLFLNFCARHISVIKLSLIMGAFFAALHVLNPEIIMIDRGPALFFAGALLTMLYLYHKNIWLPLGLHFGNNYFGRLLERGNKGDLVFGEDGSLSAILLAIIFIFYCILIVKKRELKTNVASDTSAA